MMASSGDAAAGRPNLHARLAAPAATVLLLFAACATVSCSRGAGRGASPSPAPPPAPSGASAAMKNLALKKTCTLVPTPDYRHCADPGDATQLTDGRVFEGEGDLWVQPQAVGWDKPRYVLITVDLGAVEPIAGVAFRTAAGRAGVFPPLSIPILVSDDGDAYRQAGDLVALDRNVNGPWPEGYTVRKLVTRELATRGRFVQFLVIPADESFVFSDEIEVLRGPQTLLDREPEGVDVVDPERYAVELKFGTCIRRRYLGDGAAIEAAIDGAMLSSDISASLRQRLRDVEARLKSCALPDIRSFRAVLPFNGDHAELFAVQAALWKALGRGDLTVWTPATWDPLDLYGFPPEVSGGELDVHLMAGEYRAAALNLANSTERPTAVRLRVEGLPDGPTPPWLNVAEVPWTDTLQGTPVAAALPEVTARDDGWLLSVPPGLTRQAWLTLHVTDLPAGVHAGALVVEPEAEAPIHIPFRVHVYPFSFPRETTLLLGGWSNTDGQGARGVTPDNRAAFLKHCREHFVNAPWSTSHTMMDGFAFEDDGAIRLDTRRMDDWIAQWPDARRYHVWMALGGGSDDNTRTEFAGAAMGTPEFDRRVGAWISAWVAHLRGLGIGQERLALLGHDEPRGNADVRKIVAWVNAIRAAEPGVRHWCDPQYEPAEAPPALYDAMDILCPHRPFWLLHDAEFARFYGEQKARGKELQLYSSHGPARLLDRYSYYRLQAWHCWKIGATGMFFWALGDNGGASSWNEYLSSRGSFTPLFVDDETITAGKQMEAIREGVEDYETFVMLRDALARAKAAGRADAAVANAETLLSTAADEVLGAEGASDLDLYGVRDRTRADAVRIRLLQAMTALSGPGTWSPAPPAWGINERWQQGRARFGTIEFPEM